MNIRGATVDGSEFCYNKLRLVVYPMIYKLLYIETVVGLGISKPSTVLGER